MALPALGSPSCWKRHFGAYHCKPQRIGDRMRTTRLALAALVVAAAIALLVIEKPARGDVGSDDVAAREKSASQSSEVPELEQLTTDRRSEAEVAVASTVNSEDPAPDEGSGLCFGEVVRVVGVMQARVQQDVEVVVARADSVVLSEEGTSTRLAFRKFTFSSDPGGATATVPTAVLAEPICGAKGAWTMPIPEAEMLVVSVSVGGKRVRIEDGRSIAAESKRVRLLVTDYEETVIRIVDHVSGELVAGAQVRSLPSVPLGVPVIIEHQATVEPGSFQFKPEMRSAERLGPRPPAVSRFECDAPSGIAKVPQADYPRELWVGREGYQWEKLAWPTEPVETTVVLRPLGGLDVDLFNVSRRGGAFRLSLVRNRTALCSWKRITTSGLFSARECGAGPCRLLLKKRTPGGDVLVREQIVEIPAGGVGLVQVDLADEAAASRGSIRLSVLGPPAGHRRERSFMVFVSPMASSDVTSAGRRELLVSLRPSGEGREGEFTHLPVGDYVVGVSPCGLVQKVSVTEDATTDVAFDLRALAEVALWPEGGEQDPLLKAAPRLFQVRWSVVASAPPASEGGGESILAPKSLATASWDEGAWRISCPPGTLSFAVDSPDGSSFSGAQREQVYSGPNDLSVKRGETPRHQVRIRIHGAPSSKKTSVASALLRDLKSVGGTGQACLISMQDWHAQGKTKGVEALVDVTEPGEYRLQPTKALAQSLSAPEESVVVGGHTAALLNAHWTRASD